ncbi:MAG: hypothetical protein NVS3B3_22930 [Aquirhabdus sp.]
MENKLGLILLIAFLTTFLVVGIPYWQIPYSQLSLPTSIYGLGLWLIFIFAALLRFSHASISQSFMIVGLSVPAMALVRITLDLYQDPISHNLWPFEIIIGAAIGIGIAFGGMLIGSLLAFIYWRLPFNKNKPYHPIFRRPV